MTEPEVNCLLDFIPVIFHRTWFTVVTLREFMLVIVMVRYQESDVEGFVNLTKVSIAAEVESVIVALVIDLCNWDRSQSFWRHLLVDIW